MSRSHYPWPASALTSADMLVLYRTKHRSSQRTPIAQLIADAVRRAYGPGARAGALAVMETNNQTRTKEAA